VKINTPAGVATAPDPTEALPNDLYDVRVEDVEQKTSDNSGKDYLNIAFEILAGQETDTKYQGRTLYAIVSLSDAPFCVGMLNAFFAACAIAEAQREDIGTEDLQGATLRVKTVQEEYPEGSGDMQAKVKKFMRTA